MVCLTEYHFSASKIEIASFEAFPMSAKNKNLTKLIVLSLLCLINAAHFVSDNPLGM